MMNKRGTSSAQLFLFVFAAFFIIVFLGIVLFVFGQVNGILNIDVDVGQVNLADINSQTFGQINTAFFNNADTIGTIMLLGMVVLMMLNAFIFGKEYPKIFFVLDFVILIAIFITSVYISQIYDTLIHATTLLESIYVNDIPKSSKFVLNLPYIIGTIGALLMVLSYSGINKENEDINVPQY